MESQKNGFVNILFSCSRKSREQQKTQNQKSMICKMIEDNAFLPRNRIKHIRILKINQPYSNTFYSSKMHIRGCHLNQLITTPRPLFSQKYYRRESSTGRAISPFLEKQFREEKPNEDSNQLQKSFKLSNGGTNCTTKNNNFITLSPKKQALKEDLISLTNSTNSSQNTNVNLRLSVHSRKRVIIGTTETNKTSIQIKKQLLKFYSKPIYSPQDISAKSYIVYEHVKLNQPQKFRKCLLHTAFNTKIGLEVASLTKIMTCLLVIQICQKLNIEIKNQIVQIGQFETKIEGTSAQLVSGQSYTIEQLLYGLMLPSGNDASVALAVFCGGKILNQAQTLKSDIKQKQRSEQITNKRLKLSKFVNQMNKKCGQLEMKRTFFTNPHGLADSHNKSCSSDLIILIDQALRKQIFRQIISSQCYESNQVQLCDTKVNKTLRWENTHKMLHAMPELYKGIKTGITEAAGPCLASLVSFKNRQFIIVVLRSNSLKERYKDTQKLRKWLFKKENIEYVDSAHAK